MTAETNLQASRRLFEECMNQGDLELMEELCADDCVTHDPAEDDDVTGIEAHKERAAMYLAAMPDLEFTIEDQFGSRDRVVTRWTVRGTNTGELQGMPPSGHRIEIAGVTIDRFDGVGRIAEAWDYWDNFGFMRQLGLIPDMVVQSSEGEILR
ncbi:MAG: ester cyclase [Actinobacteria bacterium]|nr:ester cyclase [Actinomycetota bacterium]